VNKSRCQGEPHDLESGGSADHHGTNFFGFLIQNYHFSRNAKKIGFENFDFFGKFCYHLTMVTKNDPKETFE
jgi:hypothetical protein